MDRTTWTDNKILMKKLWPRWKPDEALAALLNARWSHLRQDKLREAIENHRFERDSTPDIAAIQSAYAKMTQTERDASVGEAEVQRTRAQAVPGLSAAEIEEWDAWADKVLATATAAEIAAVRERIGGLLGLQSRRMLSVAVDHCRKNPRAPLRPAPIQGKV